MGHPAFVLSRVSESRPRGTPIVLPPSIAAACGHRAATQHSPTADTRLHVCPAGHGASAVPIRRGASGVSIRHARRSISRPGAIRTIPHHRRTPIVTARTVTVSRHGSTRSNHNPAIKHWRRRYVLRHDRRRRVGHDRRRRILHWRSHGLLVGSIGCFWRRLLFLRRWRHIGVCALSARNKSVGIALRLRHVWNFDVLHHAKSERRFRLQGRPRSASG